MQRFGESAVLGFGDHRVGVAAVEVRSRVPIRRVDMMEDAGGVVAAQHGQRVVMLDLDEAQPGGDGVEVGEVGGLAVRRTAVSSCLVDDVAPALNASAPALRAPQSADAFK